MEKQYKTSPESRHPTFYAVSVKNGNQITQSTSLQTEIYALITYGRNEHNAKSTNSHCFQNQPLRKPSGTQ